MVMYVAVLQVNLCLYNYIYFICGSSLQTLFEGLEDADDLNLLTYLNDELPSQLLSSMLEP